MPKTAGPPPSTDLGLNSKPADRIGYWLAGPLVGHDYNVASMRTAKISRTASGGYEVYIKNEMGFRCGLELDDAGDPRMFIDCHATNPNDKTPTASPRRITLSCHSDGKEQSERCSARYKLLTPPDGSLDGDFELYRTLRPNEYGYDFK